jgi:hypothetical protein
VPRIESLVTDEHGRAGSGAHTMVAPRPAAHNHAMKASALGCLLLFATLRPAHAQSAPSWPALAPPASELDALDADGRHKKRVGAILIAGGSAMLAVGSGMLIAGSWNDDCGAYGYSGVSHYANDGYRYHAGGCYDRPLSLAGATTSLLGASVLVPGIIVYVSGGRDVDATRRLRRRW